MQNMICHCCHSRPLFNSQTLCKW